MGSDTWTLCPTDSAVTSADDPTRPAGRLAFPSHTKASPPAGRLLRHRALARGGGWRSPKTIDVPSVGTVLFLCCGVWFLVCYARMDTRQSTIDFLHGLIRGTNDRVTGSSSMLRSSLLWRYHGPSRAARPGI